MKAFSPWLADGIFTDPERAGFFSISMRKWRGDWGGIQIQGFQFSVLVAAQMSIRRVEPHPAAGVFTGRQQPAFMARAPRSKL